MDYHEERRSIEKWQCSYCQRENIQFEVYCCQCNTPKDTHFTTEQFIPNPEPNEYPHYRYHPSDYPYNPAFAPLNDYTTQYKETFDDSSVYVPPPATMYYGEDQLFDDNDHDMPFIPYDDIRDASRPPKPVPGAEHSVNSTDFDYAFLQIQDVEQLHSIQEFITASTPKEEYTPLTRLQSEELRFSLTESAKLEAQRLFHARAHTTHGIYPKLLSITERENNWSSHDSEPISVRLISTTGYRPVPSPRTIPPVSLPIAAPRSSIAPSDLSHSFYTPGHSPPPPSTSPPLSSHTLHSSPPPPSSLPLHATLPTPPSDIAIDLTSDLTVKKTKSVWQTDSTNKDSQDGMQVDDIISFLKEQKIDKFLDPGFYPSIRSLFINPKTDNKNRFRKISWLRPGQFRGDSCLRTKWCVFNQPNPADVYQGGLGNCWFLSALSIVAEREKLIENIIVTKAYNTYGIYQVCLCMCGKWEVVTIDDSFPCYTDNKTQIYSKAVRNQLWVCLVEKAAAKMYGCYEALNSGTLLEGLSTLTGSPCETINMIEMLRGKHVDPREAMNVIWSHIVYFNTSGYLMGVATGNKELSHEIYSAAGLSQNHAYSILSISEMEGNRLMCLRDPNGATKWKGEWSNDSKKWTKEMRKALTPGGDGIFWINLDDICNYFTVIDVCKVSTGCNEARESAEFPPYLKCFSPVYLVELFDKTELDVSIYQPNKRLRDMKTDDKDIAPTDISLIILKTSEDVDETEGSCAPNPSQLAGFIGRKKQCCVSRKFELKAGIYIIVPQAYSHWETERTIPYTVATFSSKAHILESRPCRPGFYALALCILAETKGQLLKSRLHGVKLHRLNDHFLGDLLVVKNDSKQHYTIQIDYSRCLNVVTTRGFGNVNDCIPPKHKQVVNILTPDDVSLPYNINYSIQDFLSENNTMGDYGAIFCPELTGKNTELHSPICL